MAGFLMQPALQKQMVYELPNEIIQIESHSANKLSFD
jgi:hypothetical protein